MSIFLGNKGAHIYNGNIAYTCKICSKSFFAKTDCDNHKCFKCDACQRVFNSLRTISNHKCSYCATCDRVFSTYQKLRSHKCPIMPCASHTNDMTIISAITERNVLIPDDTVCRFLQLMKQQWPGLSIGVRLPAEVEVLLRQITRQHVQPCVHINTHSINIHFLQSHWVTTWQDPCDLKIKVYDSLRNQQRLATLMPKLRLFYDLRFYTPCYVEGVSQQTEVSCGAYACAFAVACANHTPPEGMQFATDSDMRYHLNQCINNASIQPFPSHATTEVTTPSTPSSENLMFENLMQEFDNQQRLQSLHMKRQQRKEKDRVRQAEKRRKETPAMQANRLKTVREKMTELRKNETHDVQCTRQAKNTAKHAQMREKEDESVKRIRKAKYLARHAEMREKEDESVKRIRQAKDLARHAEMREKEDQSVKRIRQAKDLARHAEMREKEDQSVKRIRQAKDLARHAEMREKEDQSVKRIRQAKDLARHAEMREKEDESVKRIRQAKDLARHAEMREKEDQSVKRIRQAKDLARHAEMRGKEDQSVKRIRQAKDLARHAEMREKEDQSVKRVNKEKNRIKHAEMREKEEESVKRIRQAKDLARHAEMREKEDQSVKRVNKEKNRIKHAEMREKEDESVKRVNKEKNRIKHAEMRGKEDGSVRIFRLQRDKKRHSIQRSNVSENARTEAQIQDRLRKSSARNPNTIQKAQQLFLKKIKSSPEHVCTVCHRSLYKESVVRLNASSYPDSDLLNLCRTKHKGPDKTEWICSTCQRHLRKSNMPPQAQANKMEISLDISPISDLTDFEARLLAKRIPFMKITALPRGKQKGILGSVINVPADTDDTCNHLPRTPTASGIIPVKLKRKQEFKSHVFYENIRPHMVLEAFKWLKEKNPHYQDVIDVSDSWTKDSQEEDHQLWDHLTQPKDLISEPSTEGDQAHDGGDVDDDEDGDVGSVGDGEDADTSCSKQPDLPKNLPEANDIPRDYPLDTCIQSTDPALDVNQILNFAPGEGKHPVSIMMDHGCEEMAFPKLFPKGKFGFDAHRQVSLTPKKYFNARILNKTGTFAGNVEYLFFAQYITEHKQVMDNISIAMRKSFSATPGGSVDSSFVKDQDKLTGLILKDHAYQFLQTVRGSPPYWQKAMYKLLAAVKQFGIFTFFVTLSSADLKWRDTLQAIARQQGRILSNDDVDNMPFEEKSALLRSNPVTAARHFDHRLQSYFNTFLLSPAQPLGKIKHYSYRIEFQQRGSPHAHIVLWTENAPTPDDDDATVCQFIDQYISCKIPDEDEDPDLYRLVTTVQQHHHTATCKKKGTFCRFNFPKLPSEETLIAKMLETDDPLKKASIRKWNLDVLSKVHKVLSNKEVTVTSVEEIVNAAGLSIDEYKNALKLTKYGKTVVLQRAPCETHTNYYNPYLLRAWEANLDVQFCLDLFACITYMVAYITKDEMEMGRILEAISKETINDSWCGKMKKCAKAFLNAREISAQEAVYRLLSFPLFKCNFREVFVPADLPQNRVQLLKPLSIIREMDDDSDEIFQKNITDRYANRPESLTSLFLAEFAIWYCPVYNTKTSDDSDCDGDTVSENEKVVELRNGCGKMKKASTPGVLRYHKKSKVKEPESFYYSQIILFKPWTNEEDLLQLESFEDFYQTHIAEITENRAKVEHHTDIIEAALEQFHENGPPTHMYDEISPATRQEESESRQEGQTLDQEYAVLVPDEEHIVNCSNVDIHASRPVSYSIELRPGVLEQEEFCALIRSLNSEQRNVYQHIEKWCSEVSRSNKTGTTPEPLHLFVSGGAGTGKSHLISAIFQMALRTLYTEGENPDTIKVALTAPTGTAAQNISGTTLHSAFLLPLGQTKSYVKLSDDKRKALRAKASALKLLIIDEISMVGSDILLQIHNRLCEIISSSAPFGGVSVIVVGDLNQLPPVLQQFVFKPLSNPYANLAVSLWNNFSFTELHEIMRQNDDLTFANLLNRVRTASHTDEDVALLKEREISKDCAGYPTQVLHVFSTNKSVNDHNNQMLSQLQTQHETLVAIDRKPAALKTYDVSQDSRFTGGLPSEITLAVDAKVMLIRIIDIADGLVNGAQGKIITFLKRQSEVEVVFVKFDGADVGRLSRQRSKYVAQLKLFPLATPIERTEISFTVNKDNKGLTISRFQFPLKLAWACTIHKVQGLTVEQIVVSFQHRFSDGQAYVALSRVKNLQGLFLLQFQPSKIRANKSVIEEMQRLEVKSLNRNDNFFQRETLPKKSLVVSSLNTRSLVLHSRDVEKDPVFRMSDVIVFTETWLSTTSKPDRLIPREYVLIRSDKPQRGNTRQAGGVAIVMKASSRYTVIDSHADVFLQVLAVTVTLHNISFNIVGVYNSLDHHNKIEHCTAKVVSMLDAIASSNRYATVIVGDINENAYDKDKGFQKTLQSSGFVQHVHGSTHRSGSCLDHFYTSPWVHVDMQITSCYYSDHDWISGKSLF